MELKLNNDKLDFLGTQKWEGQVEDSSPPSVTISNYKFEMRRATETTLYEMQSGTSAVYTKGRS
jgi:hypothetical protein